MEMDDPYRVAGALPHEPAPLVSRQTLWSKLRHWFWGFGCSHMGARSSRRVMSNGSATVIHRCSRCDDIVQIDWYVGGALDDRWP